MTRAVAAAAIGLSGLVAVPAHAMQIAPLPASTPYVTLVAGGCGPGFHRGPYGGCLPNGYGGGGVVVGVPAYRYGYHGGYGYHGYHYGRGYHYGVHGGYHYHYHYH